MSGRILFATDLSECSEPAGRVASEYARRLGAQLHVLHVQLTPEAVLEPALGRFVAKLGIAQGAAVTAIEIGVPAAEKIVDYAGRHGIGLIVMGTHGRTGPSRLLLGSVAERVVRTAACPVLTVPSAWAGEETPAAVVTVDLSLQRCLVCREESPDLVCARCRARIRGEAVLRKRQEERAGRA